MDRLLAVPCAASTPGFFMSSICFAVLLPGKPAARQMLVYQRHVGGYECVCAHGLLTVNCESSSSGLVSSKSCTNLLPGKSRRHRVCQEHTEGACNKRRANDVCRALHIYLCAGHIKFLHSEKVRCFRNSFAFFPFQDQGNDVCCCIDDTQDVDERSDRNRSSRISTCTKIECDTWSVMAVQCT